MQAELAWSGRQEEFLSGADAKLESLQQSTLDLSVGFCKYSFWWGALLPFHRLLYFILLLITFNKHLNSYCSSRLGQQSTNWAVIRAQCLQPGNHMLTHLVLAICKHSGLVDMYCTSSDPFHPVYPEQLTPHRIQLSTLLNSLTCSSICSFYWWVSSFLYKKRILIN